MTFDPTINLGQLLTLGSGVVVFGRILFNTTQMLRDHAKDIKTLQETSKMHDEKIEAHNTWLVRAGLDNRSGEERRKGWDANG